MKRILILIVPLVLFSSPGALEAKEPLITNGHTYNLTKKIWQRVYRKLIQADGSVQGKTYIAPIKGNGYPDKLHKNGARDTVIFVPHKTRFDKPVDLIFWFHGLGGFKERDFKTRVLMHTKSLQEEGRNFIIVIPEMPWSKNTSTPRNRQGRVFTRENQFASFTKSVIKTIVVLFDPSPVRRDQCMKHNSCQFNLDSAILIGHSAGGSTLMSASRSGGLDWLYDPTGAAASAVQVIFSDAGYGYWTDIAWRYFKARRRTGTEFILLTRKWDRPHRNTKRFLKKFRTIPTNIRHIAFDRKTTTHAGIGDQAFKWLYLSSESGCGEGEGR